MLIHNNLQNKNEIQNILLKWAIKNLKKYPWRNDINTYKILVSEVLLHKTDSKKVENLYPSFIKRFPTIHHLYKSDVKEIEGLIKNIGLIYRSQRLKKIAIKIVDEFNGLIPDNKEKLMTLYGIGDYISNAVLCFAFKKRVPIVDTNIIRIYERVFNLRSSKSRPRTDKAIWDFARDMLPKNKYVEYNYALLDFASDICRAQKPLCEICQMRNICEYVKKGEKNGCKTCQVYA